MANVKLAYRNILETGTVTSLDENSSYPLYRTYDRDIGMLFKFNSHPANLFIGIDQGAVTSYEVDRLIIPAAHTLNGLDLKLQYGTSNFPISTVTVGAPGSGYSVDNILTLVQSGAASGQVKVTSIGGSGEVTGVSVEAGGTQYRVANGLATTGGGGSNCTINVTAITGSDAASWTQGDALIINKSFTAQTKQYWRLLITSDPAAAPEIPEIYLTKDYTFERNVRISLTEEPRRNIDRDETKSGYARWVKLGEEKQYRNYDLIVDATQKASLESWKTVMDSIKPFYLYDHNGAWYFMELLNNLKFQSLSNNYWSVNLEILEVL